MNQCEQKLFNTSANISLTNALSYGERAYLCAHPVSKRLFTIMQTKQTNLAVAADVTTKKELLALARQLGPYICMFKTHIDIVTDFDWDLIEQLKLVAQANNFLLFEDRKFADIGNTVQLQYSKGMYRIAEWADIVNAHAIPGPGIIEGLKRVGLEKNRGLLLLANMSTKGNLATAEYTAKTVAMAQEHTDFVFGFIARERVSTDPQFIHCMPGVALADKSDGLGQQYLTPPDAIARGADVLIVGRGLYKAHDPVAVAHEYRAQGWAAHIAAVGNIHE